MDNLKFSRTSVISIYLKYSENPKSSPIKFASEYQERIDNLKNLTNQAQNTHYVIVIGYSFTSLVVEKSTTHFFITYR
jgi:hypothetical protein